MKRLDHILGSIENVLGVVFLAGMVISIFMQVVLRFVFNHALNWSEEVARYLMIWCTGFGISASVRIGGNIGIQAIVDALPAKASRVVRLICEVLGLVIFVFLTYTSVLFAGLARESGQLTPSTQIPIFYIYLALPVSFAFCCIRQVQIIIMNYFTPASDPQKTGEEASA